MKKNAQPGSRNWKKSAARSSRKSRPTRPPGQQRWIERLRKNAYIKYFIKEAGGLKQSPGTMQMKIGAGDSSDASAES